MLEVIGSRGPLARGFTVFNFTVGGAGLALLLGVTVRDGPASVNWLLVAVFLLLFVFARLLRFAIPPNITASLIVPIQLASILLLGPVVTAWLALLAFFAEVMNERALAGLTRQRRRAILGIIAFNLGMEALVTLAAGATWAALQPDGRLESSGADFLALLLTFLVFKTVNELLMVTAHWLRGVPVREYVAGARTPVLVETLTLPIAALLVLVHEGLSLTTFFVFVVSVVLAAGVVRRLTQAQAALAAANVDLERRVREIQTLSEVGRAISADIELDSLLETIYRRVADILVARHFFVALLDEQSGMLRIPIEMVDGTREPAHDIPMGSGLTSQVLASRKPLLIRDLQAERDSLPAAPLLVDDSPNRSWLGVPMIARGEVVGAIVLQEQAPNAYDESDLRVLSAIASQAGISIKNARLHREALHSLRVEAENRELKRINAKKSEFVNMVAHQFRTPLTTVIGYTNLLLERAQHFPDAAVADLQRHLRTVAAEARRLSVMVEELLNLSRIRSGRLPLTRQRFDLDALVSSTLASHEMIAQQRGHRLEVERLDAEGEPRSEPLEVIGDSNFLRQALANIVGNALAYSPEGSRVVVRIIAEDARARVEVVDEGPGVPEQDLERIFDEFYRAHGGAQEGQGTGLGLAITRGIVEAHGGLTWAERRGVGTAFCFTVPREAHDARFARTLRAVDAPAAANE